MIEALVLTCMETPLFKKNKQLSTPIIAPIYSTYKPAKKNLVGTYFILTEIPTPPQSFIPTTAISYSITSKIRSFNLAASDQASILSLSNELFSGTKPMEGDELKTLIKVIKGQLSDTPTSFL